MRRIGLAVVLALPRPLGRNRSKMSPGRVSHPRHTHRGEEVRYLLEGNFRLQVDGKSPVVLKAGDVFLVPDWDETAQGLIPLARRLG